MDIKLLFNTTDFSFNIPSGPISTDGICIKFGKPIGVNQKNYHFDVSDISQITVSK